MFFNLQRSWEELANIQLKYNVSVYAMKGYHELAFTFSSLIRNSLSLC